MDLLNLAGPLEPATEDPIEGSQIRSKLVLVKSHLALEVSTNHVDLLLLICCLVTGFIDSTVYNGMILQKTAKGLTNFSSIWYLCVYANRCDNSANRRL